MRRPRPAGGPGFEAPRPTEASGWIRSAIGRFRIILMDQRGTGHSSPITVSNLHKRGSPEEQARYLSYFRWGPAQLLAPACMLHDGFNCAGRATPIWTDIEAVHACVHACI